MLAKCERPAKDEVILTYFFPRGNAHDHFTNCIFCVIIYYAYQTKGDFSFYATAIYRRIYYIFKISESEYFYINSIFLHLI